MPAPSLASKPTPQARGLIKRAFFFLSLFALFSCRHPTQLELTLNGVGLGGVEPAIFLQVQFFTPGAGEPFDVLLLQAPTEDGINDGAVAVIQINPIAPSTEVEVAVGAFSVANVLLGAGRTDPVTINFKETAAADVFLISPQCGDGYFNVDREICDDKGTPGGCPDACQEDLCGDGLVNNILEECDLGAKNGSFGKACDEDCHLDPNLVFAAKTTDTSAPAQSTIVLPEGVDAGPDLLTLQLDGSAQLFAISGNFKQPLSEALVTFTPTQRFAAGATADLAQDTFPELLLLDTLAAELLVFDNIDGAVTEVPTSRIDLVDPSNQQTTNIADLAVLHGAPPSLVLLAPAELWLVPPSLDLSLLNRVALAATGDKLLVQDVTQDALEELIVAEGNNLEVFDAQGVLLRSFSCGDDGSAAPFVDLDVASLNAPTIVATRQDGRLCLFQIGAPDVELKFFATSSAASTAILQEPTRATFAVGRSDLPIGALFSITDLSAAPTQIETIALSGGTGRLSSFDLDGDSLDDLISISVSQSALTTFFHNSLGALDIPRATSGVGPLRSLTALDLNNNNKLDLVALSPAQTVLFSDAQDALSPALSAGVAAPTSAQIFDQNGDGFTDIALPDTANHAIVILRGNGAGGLSASVSISVGDPFGPLSLRVANFDNIEGLDWVVLYDDTSTIAPNDGGVLFFANVTGDTLPSPTDIALSADGASQLESKDLNGDLFREAIATNKEGNRVDWLSLDTTANTVVSILPNKDCLPITGLPVELSEDGRADILIFCGQSGDVYLQESPTLLPAPFLLQSSFADSPLRAATVGDVNGDAHFDLIAAGEDGSITLALGKGDGRFTPSIEIPGSQAISSLLVAPTPGAENLFFGDDVAGLLVRWVINQ